MAKEEKKKSMLKKDVKTLFKREKQILTPEIEENIRADERIKFARSFNFQSLFVEEDPRTDFKTWVMFGLLLFIIIVVIWRT